MSVSINDILKLFLDSKMSRKSVLRTQTNLIHTAKLPRLTGLNVESQKINSFGDIIKSLLDRPFEEALKNVSTYGLGWGVWKNFQ